MYYDTLHHGKNIFVVIIYKVSTKFMIYADFESILVPENDEKKNLKESYTNKYQKHNA